MTLVIKTTGIEDYLDGGEPNVKALILGAPSAGKTRSASFWPKPIFADCEKGRMSIADRKMPYAEIGSTADMDALLAMLKAECRKPVAQRKYQTLVIDTVDAYQRLVIAERLEAERKEALSGWGDWGYLDGKMTQFVAKLHALPMNIVVNVHIKDNSTGEGDSKVTVTGVKLKGDFKDQIAAEFDLVGHMGTYWEAEGGERVLKRGIQWWPDPILPILKDRSGQLPKWTPVTFSDDDYANLFATLISHLDNLGQSEVLETLETDPVVTHEPVKPQAGGPVAGAPLQPAATPRKAAAAKTAAPAKTAAAAAPAAVPPAKVAAPPPAAVPAPAAAAPAAHSAAITQAVTAETPPTDVGVQPAQRASVPPAPKPEIGGAEAAPQESAAPVAEAPVEPVAEAAEPVAEAPVEEAMAPEAVAEALGGEVVSDPAPVEEPATDAPAPVEQGQGTGPVDSSAATAVCGSAALPPDEQPEGFVPVQGCGKALDAEESPDLVEIAVLKTRTNLCNACFAAWRASSK